MASGNGNGKAARDPDTDKARLRSIHAAMIAGDISGAGKQAEDALADGIGHVMVLSLVAGRREDRGRLGEALELLLRAKRGAPQAPGILNQVGLVMTRLGRFDEAVAEFGVAIACDSAFAPALANRGAALLALDRFEEAERDFTAAAAIDPANLIALNGMATLALKQGDAGEARRLAAAVLAREPGFPGARLTLAGADLAEGLTGVAEAALRPLAADEALNAADRALAWSLTGDAREAEGRHGEAYAAWREAIARGRSGALPTPAQLERLAAALAGRRIPAAWGRGDPRRHVFVAGFPGSGAGPLAEWLSGGPARGDGLGEAAREWLRDDASFAAFLDAPDDALERDRMRYWQRSGADSDAKAVVDAHPLNLFRLPLIARLFPEARVLVAWRDPRDLVLSCFRARHDTPEGAAALFAAAMELAAASEAAFGLYLHRVSLDALADEAKAIADFTGLALEGTPPRVGESGIWRNHAEALAPVLPMLARFVDKRAPGP